MVCIILGFVIYDLMVRFDINIVVNRHYKYLDCDVKYKHAVTNWRESTMYWPTNNWQKDSAKSVFIRCLCDRYILSKDSITKDYIMSFYDTDVWFQENYLRDVRYSVLDTSILMRHREEIFSSELNALQAINKNSNKDTVFLKKILSDKFKEIYEIRNKYYNVIFSLPQERPQIDTLVKYKDIIFRTPSRYGDA
jgi:hypothetical protein